MTRKTLLPIVACTLFLCAQAQGKSKDHPDDAFFGLSKLHTIHFRLTNRSWDLMQPTRRAQVVRAVEGRLPAPRRSPSPPTAQDLAALFRHPKATLEGHRLDPNSWGIEYAYAKADFESEGVTLKDVGLRLKGNSSYEISDSLKRPFKLDFDRFVKGRNYHGVHAVNLSNNAYDPSQIREAMCYQFYRDAGVAAPRTAFALVYLTVEGLCDRQYLGLYTLVEEVDDKRFLKSHFDTTKGLLVKAEAMRGMPDLGDRPEPYADRFEIKTPAARPELFLRVMDLVRLAARADDATFAAQIEKTLDVDQFLRYLAMTVLVANTDSILTTGHNYFFHVHPDDQRIRAIPWDNNLAMGNFAGTGTPDQQINLSVNQPYGGRFRLIERILAIPAHRQAYRAHLRRFMKDSFNPATTERYLAQVKPVLDRAQAAAKSEKEKGRTANRDPSTLTMGGLAPPAIDVFVARRADAVVAQLDKGAAGHVPPEAGAMPGVWAGSRTQDALGSCNLLAYKLLHGADADGDYRLSPAELREQVAAFYKTGVRQTPAEGVDWPALADALDPVLAAHLNAGKRYFESGKVTREPRPQVPPALWAHAACTLADVDHSGKADLPELTAAADRLFCVCDANRDGQLDERELVEFLDELGAVALGK